MNEENMPPICGKPMAFMDVKRVEGSDVESVSSMVTITTPKGFHGRVECSFICVLSPEHDGDCSCAVVKYKDLQALARSLDHIK